MNKLLSLICLMAAVVLLLVGCAEAEPAVTTGEPIETTTAPVAETQPVKTTAPEVPEPEIVVNNGGLAVSAGDTLYYWGLAENGGFSLIEELADGTAAELTACQERGGIYILGDRVYVNGEGEILSIHRKDRTVQSVGSGEIVGADALGGNLILSGDGYAVLDASTGERAPIAIDGNYVGCGNGRVFFSDGSEDGYSASLWMYELETGELSCISSATVTYMNGAEPGFGYSGCEIVNLQLLGDAVYYSYGYFGGSGLYFQPYGGGLVRVDLTDGSSRVLDEVGDTPDYRGPVFCAFGEDGVEYVRYYDTAGTQYTMQLDTGEKAVTEQPLGMQNEPFSVDGEGYWRIAEGSGEAVQSLPDVTANAPEGEYLSCHNVCDVGCFVFYELVYRKDNPNPSSWWDYVIEYKQEAWRYDPASGESTLLWTQDLT